MSLSASPIFADRHSSVAGKCHVPAGRPTSSAGRPTGSAGRPVSAGRPTGFAGGPVSTGRPSGSADRSSVPAGHILRQSNASTSSERFPHASSLNISDIHDGLTIFDCLKFGIFTSSSYDEDFSGPDANNLESSLNAFADPDWVESMQAEMQQFRNQKVWVLVPLPNGKQAIGTKWILKNKRDARGIVCRNKARIEAIRLFLAFTSFIGFMVYQIDVKSALLYGKIAEEVYVTQPRGFEDPDHLKKVYKVVKALYGLHEAPRAWYERLSTFLLKHGYRKGSIDQTLFIKKDSNDIMLVQVYVNDIIFGSTRKDWCEEFKTLMQSEFEMSCMGPLTFFLGLQVDQRPDGIFIHQEKEKNVLDEPINVHLYRSMIGCLMYLTATRPDIMFAVCVAARRQVTPKTLNLLSVKRIFNDYAGAHGDRKFITRGCQFLGRRLISWQCKKQTIVATSFCEAKYVAAASCCGQHHFITDANEKKLIQVLKIPTENNVADLLTKSFDVTRFGYIVVHIEASVTIYEVPSMVATSPFTPSGRDTSEAEP
nr:hypothetical protein [Tanacetum cinerariifolium]